MKRFTAAYICISLVLLLLTGSSLADPMDSGSFISEETAVSEAEGTSEWYTERREEMKKHLMEFGGFEEGEELDRILLSREIDPEKPMIALTFDDGPKAGVTDEILALLEQYNVRATFFIVGARLLKEENAVLLPRMLADGCEIGNHTNDHENITKLSRKYFQYELETTNERISEATNGYVPKCLRPPGGSATRTAVRNAGNFGMAVVRWSQSANAHLTNPRRIANNIFRQSENGRELQDGDIVLLHDTNKHMVEAAKLFIPELIEAGYQLVTVSELLNLKGPGVHPYYNYRSALDWAEVPH